MQPDNDTDLTAIDFALSLATRIALSHDDPNHFLDWLRKYGLEFFIKAEMIPDIPKAGWPAVGTVLGRAILNHLPDPRNDFRPRKLPEPGRNDPCPCGSGRKFKQCCGGVSLPPMDFPPELLLPHVLLLLSKKDLAAIPHRRFNPELLAAVARDWAEKGEADRGRLMLEPLFADPRHLDARHADAFDALMDIYLTLDRPRKRKELLAAGLAAADRVLRGAARQRQAVMLQDAGDLAGAWEAFQAAMRDNPDDPSLAALEISMLQGMDDGERVRERARFWAAKLRRRADAEDLESMIGLLEDAAANPDSFAERFVNASMPDMVELAGLLADLPPVANPPRIEVLDDGIGIVEDPLDDEAYEGWAAVFDQEASAEVHAWLRRHPETWDSLRVLRDLLEAVREIEPTRWLDEHVHVPVLERARRLMDAALAGAAPKTLPWGFLGNRPWHLLALWRMEWLVEAGRKDEAIRAGEELLAWNPGDNLGVRYSLAGLYAAAGRCADLLVLSETGAMAFNRVLALHGLDRKGDALSALADAHRASPRFLKYLLPDHPRPPKRDRFGVELGGDHEAWLYREALRPAWEISGALDWARSCSPALKQRG
jgi:tetratricopeptide (TPR) repeat protein